MISENYRFQNNRAHAEAKVPRCKVNPGTPITHTLLAITLLYCVVTFKLVLCLNAPEMESNNPITTLRPLSPRLIAIGDLHGDISNFKYILQLARIVNIDGNWIGGDAIVVQVGDVADRGPHSHTIYEYIISVLIPQAKAEGGEFVHLMGNHELFSLVGDYSFVHPLLIKQFGGVKKWSYHFSPDGIYGKYITTLPVIVVRMGTIFVHGGLLKEHAKMGIEAINSHMKEVIIHRVKNDSFMTSKGPLITRSIIYKAMKRNSSDTTCSSVADILKTLTETEKLLWLKRGAPSTEKAPPIHRMVVGHTVQPDGRISLFCNKTFIAADIRISEYYISGHYGFIEFKRKVNINKRVTIQDGTSSAADIPLSQLSERDATKYQLENENPLNGLEVIPCPIYPSVEPRHHDRQPPKSKSNNSGVKSANKQYDIPVKVPNFTIMREYMMKINGESYFTVDSDDFLYYFHHDTVYFFLPIILLFVCFVVVVFRTDVSKRGIIYMSRMFRRAKPPTFRL